MRRVYCTIIYLYKSGRDNPLISNGILFRALTGVPVGLMKLLFCHMRLNDVSQCFEMVVQIYSVSSDSASVYTDMAVGA